MKLEKGKNRDSFSNSRPWLPTASMNDFHSLNFKLIFDQLDATNFNQLQNRINLLPTIETLISPQSLSLLRRRANARNVS